MTCHHKTLFGRPLKPAPLCGVALEIRVFGRGTVELRRPSHHTVAANVPFAIYFDLDRSSYLVFLVCQVLILKSKRKPYLSDSCQSIEDTF